jgi:hypothetical protein
VFRLGTPLAGGRTGSKRRPSAAGARS